MKIVQHYLKLKKRQFLVACYEVQQTFDFCVYGLESISEYVKKKRKKRTIFLIDGREEGLCFIEERKKITFGLIDEHIHHTQPNRLHIYLTHSSNFNIDFYLTITSNYYVT